MANILYIGDDTLGTTSSHRAFALIRLGHEVTLFNPVKANVGVLGAVWLNAIHYRTGYKLLQRKLARRIEEYLETISRIDLVWVDSGELIGSKCLKILKKLNCPIILYNIDDPTGKRDGRRFASLIPALSLYDVVAVVRKETAEECKQLGARRVIRVMRSYDEIAHQPFFYVSEIPVQFRSEVAFIGTWIQNEKRDEFLLELLRQGVPLNIWGSRWGRSPQWKYLQPHFRGDALIGRDYVAAIQGAKICLGLLSKHNRDLHTTRSLEVPFAGGLLCAERTSEHLEMYHQGVEAAFWGDAIECADTCKKLLADDKQREEIRIAGMRRVRMLKVGNEDICRHLIKTILYPKDTPKYLSSHPLYGYEEATGTRV